MAQTQITITVEPQYLPDQSNPLEEMYGFSYTITLVNMGAHAAQLISRHWIITDDDGHEEQVKGLGVVGHQPYLKPGEQFRYASGCRLRTPSGTMRGSLFWVDDEGTHFGVSVPTFTLDASGQPRRVH